MKRATLYQYAILWHPNEQELEAGKKSEILVKPDIMLANDQNSAFIAASRQIPDQYMESLDQVDILIRPF